MEIYPSIFVDTYQEFERRIHLIENEASFFHIDVGDGKFVPHSSFGDVEKIIHFAWRKPFELHLMIQNPDKEALSWLKTPAKRIVFHWEAKEGAHTWVWGLIRKIKSAGKEAGIALNPKTSQEKIYAFLKGIDAVVIMSVEPGFSGQKFMTEVIDKIKALRKKKFNGIIEVDGGINEETMLFARDAGADAVAAASAIFNTPDPREAFRYLKYKTQEPKYKQNIEHKA